MGQLNHGAARASKKEKMWTEASKYCDLVNPRYDVRVPPVQAIPPFRPLTQVVIAVEFDLDQELQAGNVPRSAFPYRVQSCMQCANSWVMIQ